MNPPYGGFFISDIFISYENRYIRTSVKDHYWK